MTSATRTFVKTYHDILKIKKIGDQPFTLQAKQVYCYLLSWQESNDSVFMQLKTIADDLGIGSINTARKYTANLVELGLLEIKTGKGGNSNTYFVKTVEQAENFVSGKSVIADNSNQVKQKPKWLTKNEDTSNSSEQDYPKYIDDFSDEDNFIPF